VNKYPLVDPYEDGTVVTSDGHRLYWEVSGNPAGTPAVMLHGGPGSGASPGWRRYFDPDRYRLIQFDQRGCGRSTPHAADDPDLSSHTMPRLLADIEAVRLACGVDRWVVCGGSWGSTLGLAYAQAFPWRIRALILFSVVGTRPSDVEWITRGVGRFRPEAFAAFRDAVPPELRDGSLAWAYTRMLADPDPAVVERAASAWVCWEDAVAGVGPDPRFADVRFRRGFVRLVSWYWAHHAWMGESQLLDGVGRLAGVAGVLIHGGVDVGSPPEFAWGLARRWPDAVLTVVPDAGHGTGFAGIGAAFLAATDRHAGGGDFVSG